MIKMNRYNQLVHAFGKALELGTEIITLSEIPATFKEVHKARVDHFSNPGIAATFELNDLNDHKIYPVFNLSKIGHTPYFPRGESMDLFESTNGMVINVGGVWSLDLSLCSSSNQILEDCYPHHSKDDYGQKDWPDLRARIRLQRLTCFEPEEARDSTADSGLIENILKRSEEEGIYGDTFRYRYNLQRRGILLEAVLPEKTSSAEIRRYADFFKWADGEILNYLKDKAPQDLSILKKHVRSRHSRNLKEIERMRIEGLL